MSNEKIQKVLAQLGLGSRRKIEQWIVAGRIMVDNKVAKIGDRITKDAQIQLDGKKIELNPEVESTRVLIYNKPMGEICSRHDEEGRPTVFNKLPVLKNSRWVSVGRLDFNTSGLLLFTNNGELAHKLMHPSSALEREYAVRVYGSVDDEMLQRLQEGVLLEDGIAKFSQIESGGGSGMNHWFYVTVKEGRNRLVRRAWESQHVTVSRLIRVRFGNIVLPENLNLGQCLELTSSQIQKII